MGDRNPVLHGEQESKLDHKQELSSEGELYGFGMLLNGVWELYRRVLRRGSRDVVEGTRVRKRGKAFKT